MNKVSIATKPLVYSTFRYISNHVWHAIGEYVDNSIQSYLDHRSKLEEVNPRHKLTVIINIDIDKDIITIKDNAWGIEESKFDKAFELANVPLDASGLNEYGMGMKVSSIWLSNLWSVETSAYGEPTKKTVVFNLDEVVKYEETELNVLEEPCEKHLHYTIVTLRNLSQNKPIGRQMSSIVKHLASIYTKFIRNNILELQVNGEVVSDPELTPLVASYYKTPEAPAIVWKKDINFEAGPYKVNGFIGILSKMSTSTDNGFLLFRRNKVIGTSYDTKYRPKKLCGDSGSPQYKRIYGELELEGFSVSFTKNSFTQDAELDAFIELLAEDLRNDKSFKIFDQAKNYTPTKNKAEKTQIATKLVKTIASGLDKPIVIATPRVIEQQELFEEQRKKSSVVALPSQIEAPESLIRVDNNEFFLTIGAEEKLPTDPFYDIVVTDKRHYRSVINLKHKFFEQFSSSVDNKNEYDTISDIIRAMIITEILMNEEGNKNSFDFRMKFNKIFGSI